MDEITAVISVTLAIEAIAALGAVAYIVSLYAKRKGDSRFFRMLVQVDVTTAFGGALIAAVIAGSFVDVRLPPPWGAIVVGGAIAVLLFAPIYHAFVLARVRRVRGDRTPPPLLAGD